jgi:hypothetical protein
MFSSITGWNPLVQFVCALIIIGGSVWGVVWGGIKLWHRQASRSLEEKFKPFFDKIDTRLDSQDVVLEKVEHEVTFNNGGSLKDEVRRVSAQVGGIMDVLTTKAPSALDPFPRLGLIDLQIAQGQILRKLADDIVPDNGTSGRDMLDQISREQDRVARELREEK